MNETLEERALSGGVILGVRQLAGMVLSLAGMLAATRLLGPKGYGLFSIVALLGGYVVAVGKLGLDICIIRKPEEPNENAIGTALTLLLTTAGVGGLGFIICAQPAADWYGEPRLAPLFGFYAIILPFSLASTLPLALLDRNLRYREAAALELAGQGAYLASALPLLLLYRSEWGLFAGLLVQGMVTLFGGLRLSGIRFRPRWEAAEAAEQLRFGVGYASTMWIWQARDLVNPLAVGRLAGIDAVAYVAMAVRLCSVVGFARSVAWRVYLSYLARLSGDREKMRAAVEQGLSGQVVLLSAFFLPFAAAAPEAIRTVMGERWLPVMDVVPFIAAGVIINAGFSLYSSSLYVCGFNNDVARFHTAHVLLFAGFSTVFVAIFKSPAAFGWGELAAVPSYLVVRRALRRRLFIVEEKSLFLTAATAVSGIILLFHLKAQAPVARIAVALGLLLITAGGSERLRHRFMNSMRALGIHPVPRRP